MTPEQVLLRGGRNPLVITNSVRHHLEVMLGADIVPGEIRARRGEFLSISKVPHLKATILSPSSVYPKLWRGSLPELADAAQEACAAMYQCDLLRSPDAAHLGSLAVQLAIKAGVHATRPALQARVSEWLASPATSCAGRVDLLSGQVDGQGELISLDLKRAYATAASVAAPGGSWREASAGYIERHILDRLAQGGWRAGQWCEQRPAERALVWATAIPMGRIDSWWRPIPRKQGHRWQWVCDAYEGPLWDATVDELRRAGWAVYIDKGYVWPVSDRWRRMINGLWDAEQITANLHAREIIKALAVRSVGICAYDGAREHVIARPDLAQLPPGAHILSHDLQLWSLPPELPSKTPNTYRPHIAQAIWAWSRRELAIHADRAIRAGSSPISCYVDSVWLEGESWRQAGKPATARLRHKGGWRGVWEVPYAGHLKIDGEWIIRPGGGGIGQVQADD